jgi:hypothetical protein
MRPGYHSLLRNYGIGLSFCKEAEGFAMQRYYFHVHTGERLVRDVAGMLLPDLASALAAARKAAQRGKNAKQGWSRWRIEVADNDGSTLFVYPFVSARFVTDRGEPQSSVTGFRIRLRHLWASLVGSRMDGAMPSSEGRGFSRPRLPYKLNGDDKSRHHRQA